MCYRALLVLLLLSLVACGACDSKEGSGGAAVTAANAGKAGGSGAEDGGDDRCGDGQKSEGETDVDCGGDRCPPCTATTSYDSPTCLADSDCDTLMCREGRCRKKSEVYLIVDRVPDTRPGGVEVEYRLDGQSRTHHLPVGTSDARIELGSAWRYQLQGADVCWGDPHAPAVTGFSDEDDTVEEGRIELDCPEDGKRTLRIDLAANSPVENIADGDPIRFSVFLDGVHELFDYTGSRPLRVGDYTDANPSTISPPFVEVVRSPTGREYPGPSAGSKGGYTCERYISRVKPHREEVVYVTCDWSQDPSCSDGKRNQNESDVDCGGENCEPCGMGRRCQDDSDCARPLGCEGSKRGSVCQE